MVEESSHNLDRRSERVAALVVAQFPVSWNGVETIFAGIIPWSVAMSPELWMPSMSQFIQPERRPLTREERTLLEWLMRNGGPDAQRYVSQIPDISVVGRCTCGCPSIDLAVAGNVQRKTAPSCLLADFEGMTPEGISVGVILHSREGEISELEIYAIPDVKGPFSLPTIESLKTY